MASANAERRDGKLESFLNKHLPREDYERLLTKQPCVAVVENEKPAHRHAVIGHCRLYLTEVPPKSVRVTVPLRDVESIQILREPAEFLQGKEKDEAVHIQIVFTRETRQERSLFSSLSDLSPLFMRQLGTGGGDRKDKRTSLLSPLLTRSSIQSESSCSLLHKSSSGHSLEHFSRQQKFQSPSPVLPREMKTSAKTCTGPPPFHITPSSSVTSKRILQKPSPLLDATGGGLASLHGSRKRLLLEKSLTISPQVTSSRKLSDQPQDTLRSVPQTQSTTNLSASDPTDSLCSSRSSPSLLDGSIVPAFSALSVRNPLHLSTQSLVNSERDLRKAGLELNKKTEREVLDLYILKPNTDFYQHLCSAWQDQKIEITLGLSQSSLMGKIPGSVPGDHFSHHFHTLRQELLSATTVQDSAQLAQELSTACKKYFIVKQLFWEDQALLEYLIEKLQYTPSGREMTEELAIETEYRVIVLDLLYQMLRETHAIQQRCLALTTNSGRCLRLLSNAVVHLLSKQDSLLDEMVEKSSGILSEVFRLAQQMRWPCARGGVVSPEWLLDILAKHPHIRDFCQALIIHESSTLHLDHLEPHNLLSLYHITHVLSYIIQHSQPLLDIIRTDFAEEFKYFISVTQARQMLPASAPLTSQTLTLLKHTKARVLKH